ncbi:hypothetical protein ZTR_00375 [Talaromyces verruculosus]|nr:hypothetical protein ZTR_00375 [Talaromyces verruculosus]
MQGWRITMEDAHAAILDLQAKYINKSAESTSPDQRLSFFGVYDGHGGDKVALFAGEKVHQIVAKQEAFAKGNIEQALKDGFLATDRAILDDPRYEEEVSGCTASVGVISRDKIWVVSDYLSQDNGVSKGLIIAQANAGDSRTVLGVKGRAKPLSFDHKPQNEGEKARISAAGGFVDFGRVNGNLALSRAIGDFEFKKSAELSPEQQIVTAYPDVTTHEITEDDEFLVIACDGIWDCQSSQAVVEFVRRGIAAKQELHRISEFRGPGVRPGARHQFDDSPDDYDLDTDHTRQGFGVKSGRIILLGDGTEVHADQDDEELFDATEEEDKGVQNQVWASTANAGHDTGRSLREDTPGPGLTHRNAIQSTETVQTGPHVSASPSAINADTSPGKTEESKAASKPSDS